MRVQSPKSKVQSPAVPSPPLPRREAGASSPLPSPSEEERGKLGRLEWRSIAGSRWLSAFTLLEIMIVVGIMGIIMTTGVPIVYRAWKKAPMAKALTEVQEVCSRARAEAIMQGKQVDLMFYPQEGRFGVSGVAAPSASSAARVPLAGPGLGAGTSGQLPPEITIEMLDINKLHHDFRLDESARVRFFPNGTCDELTLILLSDRGERREVMLEVTTGLAMVESDPAKFR